MEDKKKQWERERGRKGRGKWKEEGREGEVEDGRGWERLV